MNEIYTLEDVALKKTTGEPYYPILATIVSQASDYGLPEIEAFDTISVDDFDDYFFTSYCETPISNFYKKRLDRNEMWIAESVNENTLKDVAKIIVLKRWNNWQAYARALDAVDESAPLDVFNQSETDNTQTDMNTTTSTQNKRNGFNGSSTLSEVDTDSNSISTNVNGSLENNKHTMTQTGMGGKTAGELADDYIKFQAKHNFYTLVEKDIIDLILVGIYN